MGYGGALIWTGLARNLKSQFPEKKIIFVYKLNLKSVLLFRKNPDFAVYKNNPDIHKVLSNFMWFFLRPFYNSKKTVAINLWEEKYHYWTADDENIMAYKQKGHAIAIACEPFELKNVELKTKLILTKEENEETDELLKKFGLLDSKYICIEPNTKKTFTANKQWPLEHWQTLITKLNIWLVENNLEYKIAQLGVKDSFILDGVKDLTGATKFRQIKRILDKATLLVANEGGLAHLAASSNTKSIIIINPSLPKELMTYPQHINILPIKEIHNCGLKKPCPVCFDVLESISSETVFEKIKESL